jgi:site-specific recombinase XerC
LPKRLPTGQVELLLNSCDRSTGAGRRDFAILTLLGRLGLRAGEIAAIELGDIDWRAAELTVRGKGGRRDQLPLPHTARRRLDRRGDGTPMSQPAGPTTPLRGRYCRLTRPGHQRCFNVRGCDGDTPT